MRVPGYKLLRQRARWLRSRFVRAALILGYHRVADDGGDLYGNCVRPDHFAEQMAVLRKISRPIALPTLVEELREDTLLNHTVAVTFDDGYADYLFGALPHLVENEVPTTLFVTTGNPGGEFWWDELARLILAVETPRATLEVRVGGNVQVWPLGEADSDFRRRKAHEIYLTFLRLLVDRRQLGMKQIRQQTGSTPMPASCMRRALETNELRQLADTNLVSMGAHTVNHPMLSLLPAEEQEWEINASRRDLEKILEQPVTNFSYPNGSASELTRQIVRQSGFSAACTSYSDVVHAKSDPFYLPRFWVPDVDGPTFERWLLGWLK